MTELVSSMDNVQYKNTSNVNRVCLPHDLNIKLSVPKTSLQWIHNHTAAVGGTSYFLTVINREQWQDEERTLTSLVFTPLTVKHLWHTTLSVTHSECRWLCVRECVCVCGGLLSPFPVSLSLCCSAHGERAAHFRKRTGYGETSEIKRGRERGRVMNYLCPPLFGVCLVFYSLLMCLDVCVSRCWINCTIISKFLPSILHKDLKVSVFRFITTKFWHTRNSWSSF